MKKVHETEQKKAPVTDESTFSPINEFQRIEGVRITKDRYRMRALPKGIRIIGYVIIGFVACIALFAFVSRFF